MGVREKKGSREGLKDDSPNNMPPYRRRRRVGEAGPSVAQPVDPLMGTVVGDGNPTEQLTKQHQVLISEAVKNEIDKISEGDS